MLRTVTIIIYNKQKTTKKKNALIAIKHILFTIYFCFDVNFLDGIKIQCNPDHITIEMHLLFYYVFLLKQQQTDYSDANNNNKMLKLKFFKLFL